MPVGEPRTVNCVLVIMGNWALCDEERAMDWNRIKGNWKQLKGKAKQQWGELTDEDLDVIEGRRDELEGLLQSRYGYAREMARTEVDTWLRGL